MPPASGQANWATVSAPDRRAPFDEMSDAPKYYAHRCRRDVLIELALSTLQLGLVLLVQPRPCEELVEDVDALLGGGVHPLEVLEARVGRRRHLSRGRAMRPAAAWNDDTRRSARAFDLARFCTPQPCTHNNVDMGHYIFAVYDCGRTKHWRVS